MQIACPNCHTRYALDDRLVPPGGAPVQCTRCGLVFTAQRGDGPAAPGQPPAPSGTLPFGSAARTAGPIGTEAYGQSPPAGGSTQVFGAGPAAAPPPPAPPGANRTQVFGSGTSEPARTQVFGVGPVQRPPAPQAPANRTQVFGGGPGQGLPPEPPPAARTQVSGGESPSPARTQVFGGAAAARPPPPPPAAEPPPSMRTQVFGGAATGAPPPPPALRTAIFGGAAAEPPDGLDLPPDEEPRAADIPSLELPGAEPLRVPRTRTPQGLGAGRLERRRSASPEVLLRYGRKVESESGGCAAAPPKTAVASRGSGGGGGICSSPPPNTCVAIAGGVGGGRRRRRRRPPPPKTWVRPGVETRAGPGARRAAEHLGPGGGRLRCGGPGRGARAELAACGSDVPEPNTWVRFAPGGACAGGALRGQRPNAWWSRRQLAGSARRPPSESGRRRAASRRPASPRETAVAGRPGTVAPTLGRETARSACTAPARHRRGPDGHPARSGCGSWGRRLPRAG